jgi:two-component system, OmpR family, phosphate regulon sensor histidine kinase PhoR
MSRKLLIVVIVLVSFALGGIIYVQLYYIKNAYAQNELHFDEKVNAALNDLTDKLEQKETVDIIHKELGHRIRQSKPIKKTGIKVEVAANPLKKTYKSSNFILKPPKSDSIVFLAVNDSLVHTLIVTDSINKSGISWTTTKEDIVIVGKNKTKKIEKSHTISKGKKKDKDKRKTVSSYAWSSSDDNVVVVSNDTNQLLQNNIFIDDEGFKRENFVYKSGNNETIRIERKFIDEKANKIKTVIEKMVTETDADFNIYRKRLKYELIDSLLNSSLKQNGVKIPYEYSVFSEKNAVEELPKTAAFNASTTNKKYETRLFPNDIIPKKDKLVVYFPERQSHLVKSLSFLLPSSLIFSLIIIVAFAISIMMVLKQKKISDIKSDFINNMTHEFKTPIATISLAADTIVNPKVIGDQSRINHFIGIIKDENKRMNLQVERILQMSLLDKSELDLNKVPTNLHQLLQKAVANIQMQFNELKGGIELHLNAQEYDFELDEIHFTNVINNLLDNALKYTNGNPKIIITTQQTDKGVLVSVEDNGIGMSKEAQSKIFDRFFRVTKGNIHNIKGFGLGLSYVKAIVEAHGGQISVKSEVGKGSRFDIRLMRLN